ncbi:GTPase-activating protein GYP3 [[Candida] anglica]
MTGESKSSGSTLVTPVPHRPGNGESTHSRTVSAVSHNYSLLDIYDSPSPPPPPQGFGHTQIDENTGSVDIDDILEQPDITASTNDNTDLEIKTVDDESTNASIAVDLSSSTQTSTTASTNDSQQFTTPITSYPNSETILKSKFDRYGFKKVSSQVNYSNDEYNDWFVGYTKYSSVIKKKWTLLLKSNGLKSSTSPPTRFPPKSDKVKKLIRKGIPPEWRGNAWFFYAGGYERLNKHTGVYERIVKDTTGIHNKDTEVIERDLNRTFPDNIYFNKSLQGSNTTNEDILEASTITSLRRVLTAFAHYQPQIGYCQSLNFLVGLLLLFMSEERAFWMLVILTERIIPKVHSANLEGVHIDQGVLMLCIKEYIPHLWSILGKNFEGEQLSEDKILTRLPPITLVTSSWFMSVFIGLPIETTLRIWDILWYEGSKTLFRVSLTISKMCLENPEFQVSRQNSNSEVEQIELFQFMQNFPKTILDPNILVDHCFKKIGGYGFGSLSQDEINQCREFVSKQRAKLNNKKHTALTAEMSDDERRALETAGAFDGDIHDVYGFHRSIMSGVVWNKNISNIMKKKFTKKSK